MTHFLTYIKEALENPERMSAEQLILLAAEAELFISSLGKRAQSGDQTQALLDANELKQYIELKINILET